MAEGKTGRPLKIVPFLEAMGKVLDDGINAIICTDEELFILANEQLEECQRICYTTFKNYKAKINEIDLEEKAIYSSFLSLYKKALIRQKNELFRKMGSDDKARPRRAWIIERKFEAWNLRHVSENKHDMSHEIKIRKVGQK